MNKKNGFCDFDSLLGDFVIPTLYFLMVPIFYSKNYSIYILLQIRIATVIKNKIKIKILKSYFVLTNSM